MDNERTLQGSILKVVRRYAAGIHVSEDAVRIAIVSRRIAAASASVCVDRLECAPLPEGAVVNGDFVDRAPIVAALREAFGRLPVRGPWRLLRCSMGMASAATFTASVPLMQLIEPRMARTTLAGNDPLGVLESTLLAEAERITGIERGALAIDWSVQARDPGRAYVSIATTARWHVEARMETVSAAISLSAVAGEPLAALRAMRHMADTEIDADARYFVCWLERTGLHGWFVEVGDVQGAMRYPAPEYRSIGDALRDLAGDYVPPRRIYVGSRFDGARGPAAAGALDDVRMPGDGIRRRSVPQRQFDDRRCAPVFAALRGRVRTGPARGDAMTATHAVFLDGFNLLPHRARKRCAVRRRRLAISGGGEFSGRARWWARSRAATRSSACV
ncbi:Type IV pilus biogeneis protein PilM [Candidatus Burkholderia brachyanthoides]|nr:Type IV pilus biogeneis protein PilM [Candidatus Burkholderia brachyanthoides]